MDNGPVNFDFPLIYNYTKIVFAKRELLATGITQMTLQGVKKQRNLKGTHLERHFAYPDTFNVSENYFDGVVPI